MKKDSLIFGILAILCTSCGPEFTKLEIEDVTRMNEIEINNPGNPHTVYLEIEGEISGKAVLSLREMGGTFVMEIPFENQVDTTIHTDWYDKNVMLTYVPEEVAEGQIIVKYYFGLLD